MTHITVYTEVQWVGWIREQLRRNGLDKGTVNYGKVMRMLYMCSGSNTKYTKRFIPTHHCATGGLVKCLSPQNPCGVSGVNSAAAKSNAIEEVGELSSDAEKQQKLVAKRCCVQGHFE